MSATSSLNKPFAQRVAAMIESHLIWHKHYIPWAESLLVGVQAPPAWLQTLAAAKYKSEALKVIHDYIHSEPFELFDEDIYGDLYVACLFLRYKRLEISWATFLQEAGAYTDVRGGRQDIDFFFAMLNKLEEAEYSVEVEKGQSLELQGIYCDVIDAVSETYQMFQYFSAKARGQHNH